MIFIGEILLYVCLFTPIDLTYTLYKILFNRKKERRKKVENVAVIVGLCIAEILVILLLKVVLKIKMGSIKEIKENKEIQEIVDKFPENKEVCREILKNLGNTTIIIKESENKENQASFYIAVTNTIWIANIKDTYTRIQTIAHECLHSMQDRRLLLFNFIYANFYMFYFVVSLVLLLFGIGNVLVQNTILLFLGFIFYIVRSYLEIDAMTKARYVAENYMRNYIKENPICSRKEVEEIGKVYGKINQTGITFTCFWLAVTVIRRMMLYNLVALAIAFIL